MLMPSLLHVFCISINFHLKIQDLVKIEKTFLMKIKNNRFNEDFLIED